jgi:CheY-like chemotaxis protein
MVVPPPPATPGCVPGSRPYNEFLRPGFDRPGFDGRYIVVADEDRAVVGLVIETLLGDGHAVFHAYDGVSAKQLALGLKVCDLVISNTRVGGAAGVDLIHQLREPFTANELRAAVRTLLEQ